MKNRLLDRISTNYAQLKFFSPISIIIDFLPGGKGLSFIKSAIFFGMPFISLLTIFLYSRAICLIHNNTTILFIYLASSWPVFGPYLIWRYENITLSKFWKQCKYTAIDNKEYAKYKKNYEGAITSAPYAKIVLFAWISIVVLAFLASFDFMRDLGILAFYDPWWILQVLGIALYGYITGIGFLGVCRTCLIIRNFLKLKIKLDPYHLDQRGGFSFIGKFLTETCLLFASGAVFIPILITVLSDTLRIGLLFVTLLVAIYAITIATSFFYPVFLVHMKLKKEKYEIIHDIRLELNKLKKNNKTKLQIDYIYKLSLQNDFNEMLRIIDWPFNTRNLANLLFAVALPLTLFVLQFYLTALP